MWRPAPKLLISDWAEKYAVLGEESAEPGRWRSYPYQIAMMDAFCAPEIESITVKKSARIGYTKVLDNVIGYYIHQDPCGQLMVQPTIDDAEGWSKDNLQSMIRTTGVLSELISDSPDSGNTILKKSYPGGKIHVIGANSPRGFRRITVRNVYFDEVDGYPPTAGAEGDQIKLGTKRSETFWNRKIGIGSTPTVEYESRIDKAIEASDKGYLFIPCPHCGEFHIRLFREPEKPIFLRGKQVPVSILQWEDDEPDTAVWICPSCSEKIGHEYHREVMDCCGWIGEYWAWESDRGFVFLPGFRGSVGFSIWAGYGFSPNTTPAKIVQEFLDVKSDFEQLKTFVNTVLGETWVEKGETVSSSSLMVRGEQYAAEVPAGVKALTLGADIQKDRIECEVVGWNEKEESWSVDYLIIPGDPSGDEPWDELEDILADTWEHESGVRLSIVQACIDEGYLTSRVRTFVQKAGAHVWSMKGMDGPGRPIVESPDQRLRRLRRRRKVGVRAELLGTHEAKVLHYRRLRLSQPGPGYCHFPIGRDEEYYDQLTAEKMVVRYKKGRQVGEWVKKRERNEAQDCRLLAHAAIRFYGVENMNSSNSSVKKARSVSKPAPKKKTGFGKEEWIF